MNLRCEIEDSVDAPVAISKHVGDHRLDRGDEFIIGPRWTAEALINQRHLTHLGEAKLLYGRQCELGPIISSMVVMKEKRFEIHSHSKGFWSVIDRRSQEVASYRNLLMVKLQFDEADAFAELLNEQWRIERPAGDTDGPWGDTSEYQS